MALPEFAAEAALYKTNGYYKTDRQAIHLSARMISPIYPAEVIEVHSCPPGWSDIGGTCWPDPLTEPGGGGGDPGTPGGNGEGGAPHGGGKPGKPPRPPRPPRTGPNNPMDGCTAKQIQSNAAKRCNDQIGKDLMDNVPNENRHYFKCTGSKIECCQNGGDVTVCDEEGTSPR